MWASIRPNTGSGVLGLGTVTAAGTLGSIAVAAARVPALTTLATAATARKRRRVGSTGGNIMGWSIADVFVGGVLSTLSAWVMGFASFVARVRAGVEVRCFPSACFYVTMVYGKDKWGNKEKARASADWKGHPDWRALASSRDRSN